MRIIFDAYELIQGQGKSLGIYNYAKNLLKALVEEIDDKTELLVICNSANQHDFSYQHPRVRTILVSATPPRKIARLIWFFGRAAIETRKLQADVYFSPKGFCPKLLKTLSPALKTVVIIHDLIPLWYAEHFPGYFGRLEEWFINNSIVSSTKYADRIIAISQATRDDIAARTGRTQGVAMIYNGISVPAPGPRPYPHPYIFAMSSTLPHKNAEGILAAYQAYRHQTDSPLPLFICGIETTAQDGVTSIKAAYASELHAYFAYAELFLFLSFTEGFGFPPLEALAHGTPVLCSDIPVLREISKGTANYVALDDSAAIGRKIVELLNQENSVELQNQRRAVLNEFTWAACAKGVLKSILN
ncbi:glycosyltransferase family 4 protein [Methylomonas paludis]|uniref:Glycosyltransferase family 4 protein n=1 Tax=Methylomonas paludis TaxID=1173101 RepID=A0A975MNI2_9GAMM|nr:glycosyltransferase family 1 protein [Methylomonas paludis]QWF71116.1 glycosyltransferase family 4 protein [Methylomonas paludis]